MVAVEMCSLPLIRFTRCHPGVRPLDALSLSVALWRRFVTLISCSVMMALAGTRADVRNLLRKFGRCRL